jgi:hypothetical protein
MRLFTHFLAVLLMQPLPLQPGASGGTYIPKSDTFEILTAEPLVKFLTRAVQPPSTVYITNRDALQVSAASSQAGEALVVSWRVLKADGHVAFSQFTMPISSDRALNLHKENLPEGFLLSLSCKAAVATTRGQTFARIFLTTSGLGGGQPAAMLMSDYVTTAMAPGFPNGRILAPSEGPGNLRVVPVANPAFGQDWNLTVPTNARWRFVYARATLNTDASAAQRFVQFDISSTANLFYIVNGDDPAGGPGPNSGGNFSAAAINRPHIASSGQSMFQVPPDLYMLAGGIMQTATINIGPGDTWVNIGVLIEEWLDNV